MVQEMNKYCLPDIVAKRVTNSLMGILLPILLLISSIAYSQTYPVQASLYITPPYSVYLSDYTTMGSNRLTLSAFLSDLNRPDLDVRFRLLIEGAGIEIKTKQGYIGKRFTLLSGAPTQIYGDDLQEYFALQNLDLSGISRSQLEKTGALPEGIYRFTLEILEYNRGVQISNSARSSAWLILNDPPLINLPLDNEVVAATDPQTIRFQWTPRHTGSPNSSFSTEYFLKVVEIWPEGRNPNDAINTTNAIFETTTTNNYFVYGMAEPPLIPGRKYAFQVQARANSGIDQLDLFKNNGYSVVRSFIFGESCNFPANLIAESRGNSYINLAWEPSSTNTAFLLKFKEDTPNANWFDKFSYLPNYRIDKLKPGAEYQVIIQAMCGTLLSEEAEPVILSTDNSPNNFTCGAINLNIDLANKWPVKALYIGDTIYAGDFGILLDSIGIFGNKYSGSGIATFPFLNFVKAKVRFEGVSINTDYRMYDGIITTYYNPNSSMMYDLDGNEEPYEYDETTGLVDEDSVQSADVASQGSQFDEGAATQVDSIYINDEGEIIAVIDSEETIVQPPEDGKELTFIDSSGNQITVNSGSELQKNGPAAGSSIATTESNEEGIKFVFGPLIITLQEEKEPTQSGSNCTYEKIEASIELTLEDLDKVIAKTIKLESAVFSYTKNCETGEFVSAKLDWQQEGGKNVGGIGNLEADLLKILLEIDANLKVEGDIEFHAHLDQDKQLTGLAVLRAGISGGFRYTFVNYATGNTGNFDFAGVENINLDLVKQSQVIASLQNGALDKEGVLSGKIRLLQEVDYKTAQFSVRVKKLVFDVLFGVGQEFFIEQGSSTLLISGMNLIDGELKVVVDVEDNNTSAAVEGKDLAAFGMTLTNLNVNINLDSDLNFTSVHGSLVATHPEFGIGLDVGEFLIENGEIKTFNMGGEINYKELQVVIQQANYDNATKAILLNAFVEIEQNDIHIAAQIEDFSIDKEGNIGWGGYNISFDGVKTFGPLTVAISGESGEKSGKYRATTAKASLSLDLEGTGNGSLTITDATISYLKHRNKEQYKDIKIIIEDVSLNAPNIGLLNAQIRRLNIEIKTDEDYLTGSGNDTNANLSAESFVQFDIGLEEELSLSSLLFIEPGVSGNVSYHFSGDGLKGNLDFTNVENLNIIARKGESVLASLTDASIPENGVLLGTVNALPGASFTSAGFTVEVEELFFDVVIPFDKEISAAQITSGRGKLNINNVQNIEGSIALELLLDETSNLSAHVANTSEISALGMNLTEFDLQVELQPDLQITSIKGQLHAAHPQFDATLLVSNFLIEDGKLQTFNIEGKVTYQGFNLELHKADYVDNTLIIDGKVAINITESAAWLAVEELTISADGTVTIRGIEGELDKAPVYISFSASMDETRFTGTFNGELSGIGLEGKIDIGVADDLYNYAYLELTAKGNIPLAGSGLKLTKLGGQFGYNYALVYEHPGSPPEGNPQEGNYVVGLTLGVADVANMVEVTGNSVIQFGNNKFDLNLNGSISIPKENSVAKGSLNVHYTLPDNTLDGSLALDVNVPAQSGRLLTGKFDMNYAMGNSEWSVTSSDISVLILTEIDFTGNIALEGSGNNDTFSGVLSGSSSYDFSYRKEFEAFNAKLIAELNAGFNFMGDIAFDESGAEGDIMLSLYANGELGIETFIGGYDRLIGLNGSSLARLKFDRESALLSGQMNVVVYFLGFDHEVDIDIEQQI